MICIRPNKLGVIAGTKPIPVIDGKIKWHIDESKLPSGIDKYKIILSFQKAYELLSDLLGIKFESTSEIKDAPIVIRFRRNGDSDLISSFTPETLAFALGYYEGVEEGADIYFNIDQPWWDMHKPEYFSLKKVCVHETIHCLGFEHSNDQNDIMFWQYQNNDEIVLTRDTIESLRKLYPQVPKQNNNYIDEFLRNSNYLKYIRANELKMLCLYYNIAYSSKNKSVVIENIKSLI